MEFSRLDEIASLRIQITQVTGRIDLETERLHSAGGNRLLLEVFQLTFRPGKDRAETINSPARKRQRMVLKTFIKVTLLEVLMLFFLG